MITTNYSCRINSELRQTIYGQKGALRRPTVNTVFRTLATWALAQWPCF